MFIESIGITPILNFIGYIMTTVGLWRIFGKSGVRKWLALLPIISDFQLAKCADCEDEASGYVIALLLYNCFNFFYFVMTAMERGNTLAAYMALIVEMAVGIVLLVFRIRIYNGMCRVYGRRRAWVLLWLFFQGLAALIWGSSDKYQPSVILEREERIKRGEGIQTQALDQGLSINIRRRTARKLFSVKTLLKDIRLDIPPGRMVLLLGGSGAGKTTFFNAVTGYEQADATISLNGMDVYSSFSKMKYEIGFVPQQELIRGSDSVYRTLMDAAMLRLPTSVSSRERSQRVEEVMDLFGLSAIQGNVVSKQSGGQKKRISIAMEYISNPSLFILDEPDSGLDGILARELMRRLHDISREGKIVIVITHTPDRVIDLFDDIIVLAKDNKNTGRLVFYGEIDEARRFFGKEKMEDIVKVINRPDEGGDGKTDELLSKYEEARNVS